MKNIVKSKNAALVERIKSLNGDPHYIALGMGIGIFVAATPTMPFHTILALGLAFVLGASKRAAYIGMWASNPFTMVPIYLACYYVGFYFFKESVPAIEQINDLIAHLEGDSSFFLKLEYFYKFIQYQAKTFAVMIFGGLVLGIPAGFFAYGVTFFITKKVGNKYLKAGEKNT